MNTHIRPAHPGNVFKTMVIDELGITVTDTAKLLKVSRPTLSAIINERSNITPEMAIRIERVFGCSAELLINIQRGRDMWDAVEKMQGVKLPRYKKTAAALPA